MTAQIIPFPKAKRLDLATALAAFGRACLVGMVAPAEIEAAARDFEQRVSRMYDGGDSSPIAAALTEILALVALRHAEKSPDGGA